MCSYWPPSFFFCLEDKIIKIVLISVEIIVIFCFSLCKSPVLRVNEKSRLRIDTSLRRPEYPYLCTFVSLKSETLTKLFVRSICWTFSLNDGSQD